MKTNPYQILGVARTASQEEIRLAYRKLAAKHHTDKGGDSGEFKAIKEAYDLISSPEKRADFDKKSSEKPITKLTQAVREVVDEYWASVLKPTNTGGPISEQGKA